MEISRRMRLLAAGAVMTVAAAAGGIVVGANGIGVRDSAIIHEMSADYPSFDTLGDLADRSTVVVRGKVTAVSPSVRNIPAGAPLDQMPKEKRDQVGYLTTDMRLKVERVLSGPAELAESTIVVTQLGGQAGRHKFVMEDEPLVQQGRSYLLFLERTDDGKYVVVGGGQGRYEVAGGKLKDLTDEAGARGVAKELHGRAADDFEKNFKDLVAKSPRTPRPAEPRTGTGDVTPGPTEGKPATPQAPSGR